MKNGTILDQKETVDKEPVAGEDRISPLALLREQNFRLLWLGEAISLIGDQFYLIALPWLTLQLTGDAVAVGTVLAMAGVPRALFMLIGGAFTDRFSPRFIMMSTNIARMLLVGFLAGIVATGAVQLWMLYLFALAFGLADAFFYPAQTTIVPQLVSGQALQTANAVIQGTAQLSLFLGPVLAGTIIAFVATNAAGTTANEYGGLASAFALDALTFLVSAVTLWRIRTDPTARETPARGEEPGLLNSIGSALRYVGRDPILRTFLVINMAISTLMTGVMAVGIPVLANTRFVEGAAAFGLIMSALGAGSLMGIALASLLRKPRTGLFGPIMLLVTAVAAGGLILIAFVPTVWAAAGVTLFIGMANGYVMIMLITWLQLRTPAAMLGRIMSLVMFSSVGLAPVATAVAGLILSWNLNALFWGAGVLLLFVILLAVLNPTVRTMPANPVPDAM